MKYKKINWNKTTLAVNESVEGETIETKILRIVGNNEPVKDGAPIIYTDRRDGVLPEYDIRTDRFEIALGATDAHSKSKTATRNNYFNELKEKETKAKEKQAKIDKLLEGGEG